MTALSLTLRLSSMIQWSGILAGFEISAQGRVDTDRKPRMSAGDSPGVVAPEEASPITLGQIVDRRGW